METQARLWAAICRDLAKRLGRAMGQTLSPWPPARNDKRFKDKDWVENSIFDSMKQVYLVTTTLGARDGGIRRTALIPHTKQKAKFYVENIANALSPTNFPLTNPEVMRATLASIGRESAQGMEKLETDLKNPTAACASRKWMARPSSSAKTLPRHPAR